VVICLAAGVLFLTLGLLRSRILAQAGGSGAADSKSEPGLTYTNVRIDSSPLSIHVLKIDRSRKDLTFFAAHAKDHVLGVSLIAEQAWNVAPELGRAIAGINGDFYLRDNPSYAGDPRGLQIVNGEIISGPSDVCVWFGADGTPHLDEVRAEFEVTWQDGRKTPFGLNQQRGGPPPLPAKMALLFTPTYGPSTKVKGGQELILEKDGDSIWLPLRAGQTYRARVREVKTNGNTRLDRDTIVLSLPQALLASLPEARPGIVLQISTSTSPDLARVKTAIGGGPTLIKDGKPFSVRTPPAGVSGNWSERSKYERHPRSAVGWSPTHIYLIVVDGRQPGLSMGMRLAELADYMAGLGCNNAMNLDGGKSAQMWMSGHIMNSPCQGEDTVASSLLVLRKP